MATRNRMKVRLKPRGMVELRLERRNADQVLTERITFSIPRRTLERALAEATLEAPWAEVLRQAGYR